MREFSTQVKDALLNGLKPGETARDTMFFEDLYNLVPDEMALKSYEDISDVADLPDREGEYPFPQWFKFEHDNLLITKNGIHNINDDFIPFDLTPVDVTDMPQDEFSEPFRAIDYGEDWMLVNRDECVYKRNGEVFYTTLIQASAILKNNNRTIIGGSTNGLWTDKWLAYIKAAANSGPVDSLIDSNLPSNFILWSSFDSHDFPFGLLYPREVNIKDLLYSNQFGFMEMPFTGAVLEIIESQGQVFIFGEDGICSIAMSGQSSGAGYGITGEQPFGIKQRGAAGGNESSLVFIDIFDQLWKVTGEGLRKLDFSQYMAELSGDIYISRDPDEDLFYIGDENTSFLLNGTKLTRIYQTVQHASGAYPGQVGVAYPTGDEKALIKTQKIDLGIQGQKTLTGAALVLDSPVKGVMRASSDVGTTHVSTPDIPMNPQGYGATRIYGKNHTLEIELESFRGINVDNIELKWQVDDKRQTRGAFATQDATGAG